MSTLKIGIIGAGGISAVHLPRLHARADAVELAAIADVNEDLAKAVAEKFGIGLAVADYRALLPHVDAVLVCVPTHLHAEIAVAALQAGKAVFCEKPMARTLEGAQAMATAAAESGAPLQLGFVRRFDDEWQAWRAALLAEKIGRPVVWRDIAAGPGPSIAWFTQEEKGGGPFLDGCIHNLDFALHTFGPAQWVFCHGRTLRESNTAIDTGTATVRFVSGDELMLAWSWGLPAGTGGSNAFEFLGPRGVLKRAEGHYTLARGEGEPENVPYPPNALGNAFDKQMDEFIAVARREKPPRAGAAEGLASLQVALAILQSARSEQVVHL